MNKDEEFFQKTLNEINKLKKDTSFDIQLLLFINNEIKQYLNNYSHKNDVTLSHDFYFFLSKKKEFDLLKYLRVVVTIENIMDHLFSNNWSLDEIDDTIDFKYELVSKNNIDSEKNIFKLKVFEKIFCFTKNQIIVDTLKNMKFFSHYFNSSHSEDGCVLTDYVFDKFLNDNFGIFDKLLNNKFNYLCNDIFFDLIKKNKDNISNKKVVFYKILLNLSDYLESDKVNNYINIVLNESCLDMNENPDLIYNLLNKSELDFDIKGYVERKMKSGEIDYILNDSYLVLNFINSHKNDKISKILLKNVKWLDVLIEEIGCDDLNRHLSNQLNWVEMFLDAFPIIEKEINVTKEKQKVLIDNLDNLEKDINVTINNYQSKNKVKMFDYLIKNQKKQIRILRSLKQNILDINKKKKLTIYF